MAKSAGLNVARIAISDRADNTWTAILTEAEEQVRTEALLQRAQKEYDSHRPLTEACKAYTDWVAAGRPRTPPLHPQQPLPSTTQVETPPAGGEPLATKRRALPWVAAGLLVAVLLVFGIAYGLGSMRGSPTPALPTSGTMHTTTPAQLTDVRAATAIPTSPAASKVPCPGRNNVEMSEELQIEVRDGYIAQVSQNSTLTST